MALSWGCGTVLIHQLPASLGLFGVTVVAALALAARVFLGWRWIVWFAAGILWTSIQIESRLSERLAPELEGTDLAISGWVAGFPGETPGQTSFAFRVESAELAGSVPRLVRLTWYDPEVRVEPGTHFDLLVRLKRPRGLQNPGGFDYERWLFQSGYGATGYVRRGEATPGVTPGVRQSWLRLRARVADLIEGAVPTPDGAALLVALAVGERFAFTDEHWSVLRRTGTSHLVAISGLHVGLIAGFGFFVVRRLALRMPVSVAIRDVELAASASLVLATLYSGLAGFTLPTQRALIMLSVGLAALVSRRSVDLISGFSIALLLVLVWDPMAPLSAAFWLSFAAVALIWCSARRATNVDASRRGFRVLFTLLHLQWNISLGLVPLTALFFAEVSLISPLVNIVAIPLFGFVLVPLTLGSVLAISLHPIGAHLVGATGALMGWVWGFLVQVGSWPWASVTLGTPPAWVIGLAAAGAVAATAIHSLQRRWLAWIALLPIFLVKPPRVGYGGVAVDVLDVGHGLAVLVETRSHTLLYDAGPLYRSGFDTGKDIVLPAMRAKGWQSLDVILVSHGDSDHAGGAASVATAFPAARVIMGPDVSLPGGTTCEAGQSWTWDGVVFLMLHPDPDFPYRGNDSSCVLRIGAPAGSILLTGDIEAAGERVLVSQSAGLSADVIVVPHHGSSTSSSPELVEAVGPAYALVSAGYRNQWGFPKGEVAARWENAGSKLLVTGELGAIAVSLGVPQGVGVEGRRIRRRRYWSDRPAQ